MLGACLQFDFLCISAGAINNDTYQSMLSNDILKYLKTMERKHPKHRARYSHTAWLHSTIPDPIQSNMIDRYVVVSVLILVESKQPSLTYLV